MLILLGSSRNTLDVDYVGIDIPGLWTELQRTIAELANEMEIKIEAVPYDEMIPPLPDSGARQIPVGMYGNVQVVVIDPYAMALDKIVQAAIPRAQEFDLTPRQMQQNSETVRQMISEK